MADPWMAQLDANTIDDPGIWKERLPNTSAGTFLERLDSELRCQICQELYRAPVSLPCQHTFCSECIRRAFSNQFSSINRSTRCVSCNLPVDNRNDKGLVPNRALENAVMAFRPLRNPLLQVLEEKRSTEISSEEPVTARRRSARVKSSSQEEQDNYDEEENNSDLSQELHQKNNKNKRSPRKKKSKPIYGKKKRAELREMCRKEGLPDHGSEEDLKQRHQAFITLYNSESDSRNPMSASEIVTTIMSREKERNRLRYAPTLKDIKGNQTLTEQMNQNFSQLIANAKLRREPKLKDDTASVGSSSETVVAKSLPAPPTTETKSSFAEKPANPEPGPSDPSNDIGGVSRTEQASRNTRTCLQASTTTSSTVSSPSPSSFGDSNATNGSLRPRVVPPSSPSASSSIPNGSSGPRVAPPSSPSNNGSNTTARNGRPSSYLKRKAPSPPSIIGPWSCSACTFYNTNRNGSFAKCEVCQTARTNTVDLTQ